MFLWVWNLIFSTLQKKTWNTEAWKLKKLIQNYEKLSPRSIVCNRPQKMLNKHISTSAWSQNIQLTTYYSNIPWRQTKKSPTFAKFIFMKLTSDGAIFYPVTLDLGFCNNRTCWNEMTSEQEIINWQSTVTIWTST